MRAPTNFKPARVDLLPVFSIPMLRGMLDLNLDPILQDCRDLVKSIGSEFSEDNSRNYTTYFDNDVRMQMYDMPWFKEFADIIKDTYAEFCFNVLGNDMSYVTRRDIHFYAWVSVYQGQHQHEIHNHVNSHVSGTWYLKTGENTSPIKFLNPNLAEFSHKTYPKSYSSDDKPNVIFTGTPYSHSHLEIYPVDNEFLLWPSYLMHSVPPKYTEQDEYERISLSFNLKHKDMIDHNWSENNLHYGFLKDEQK